MKTIEILSTVVENQGFAIFSSSRLWSSIGDPFGLHFGSLLASRWLQHGFQRSQDGSKTTQGASKTPLICLQDRPSTSQDASKTATSAPKMPRLSKSLQDGSVSLQDVSNNSPGEVFEAPSCLQELAGGALLASNLLETLCCKLVPSSPGLYTAAASPHMLKQEPPSSMVQALGRRDPRRVYNLSR